MPDLFCFALTSFLAWQVRRSEWLTTVPIVAGVALSSWSDASFHLLGFVAAVCSNFMFSARGINAKTLRRLHGTPQGLDDMHLFYHVSKFGEPCSLAKRIFLFRVAINSSD